MKRSLFILALQVAACIIFATMTGCATAPLGVTSVAWFDEPGETLTQKREQRAAEVAKTFEQQRAYAEYQDARGALERGDLRGCEKMLRQLLLRDGKYPHARLLLADVLISTDRNAEAFKQIELASREAPDDPQVLHAMAMLLDATGHPDEALAYYRRAAELDPAEEIYATAYDEARRVGACTHEDLAEVDSCSHSGGTDDSPASDEPSSQVVSEDRPSGGTDDSPASDEPSSQTFSENRRCGATTNNVWATQAITESAPAVPSNPDNPRIPLDRAISALADGDPTLARRILEAAIVDFPQHAPLHRCLGVARYRLGDFPAAELALRQALSLDKSDSLSYFLINDPLKGVNRWFGGEGVR